MVWIILLFLNLILVNSDFKLNSSSKHQKEISINKKKFKDYEKKSNNYKKRRLQVPSIKDCIDGYIEESFFDLNFHFDLLNLLDQLNQNLGKYESLINNSMKKIAEKFKLFLEINRGFDLSIRNDIIKNNFGITKWDQELIDETIYNVAEGMFSKEITYILWFKLGEENTMGNEIFYAEPIIFDGCRQPLVGLITLNPDINFSEISQDYLEMYIFHKFTHLLGFHYNFFLYFDEDNESEFVSEDILKTNSGNYFVQSPNVMEFAQNYFGCHDNTKLNKIPIEKDEKGNLHWPSRLLLGDYMTEFNYPGEKVLSGFTLAFLEDLGYLRIKKYSGGLMRFGKNQGCDFIDKNCFGSKDSSNNEIKFTNDFYYPNDANINTNYEEPSCSSGRQSKTIFKLTGYEVGNEIPVDYNYFQNNLIGGYKPANYCPVSQFSNSQTFSVGYCYDTKNNPNSERGESFSSSSFCALSSLVKKNNPNDEQTPSILAICFEMSCTDLSLTIKVGEDYFVCPREGGIIKGTGYNGYLLCPDYNLICTGEEICNNIFDCIEEESTEKENSFTYIGENGYISQTTQDSSIYSNPNDESIVVGFELTENGKCSKDCAQCKINNNVKICVKCRDTYYLIGSKESEEVICVPVLGKGYYQNSLNSVYYPCISNCEECTNENSCSKCIKNYKVQSNICVDKVLNCKQYSDDEKCIECNLNYFLVKDKNNEVTCQKISSDSEEQYYTKVEDGLTYHIKCSESIDNCNTCTSENSCTSCINGYGIIDNNQDNCIFLTNEYYYDSTLKTNKLCSYKNQGCKKCSSIGTDINCIECDSSSNYALVYGQLDKCNLISNIGNDKSIFYNSNTLKYYKCNDIRYHSVENCLTCQNEEMCESCQEDYVRVNSGTLCASLDLISKQNYFLKDGDYYLCSEKLKGCEKCENENSCIKCYMSFDLDENDKCIPTALAMTKYYLDDATSRYISCSKIENCEECTSSTKCTRCNSGYEVNNNKCQSIKNNNNNDNNTKDLATAAIILSTFGIVISIVAIVLIFLKKLLFKTTPPQNEATESVKINNEEPNEITVHKNQRTIHNEPRDNLV